MVDPGSLPISDALRGDLAAWNEEFEGTYPDGWASDEVYRAWRAAGRQLAARLRVELGCLAHGVRVVYVHDDEPRAI